MSLKEYGQKRNFAQTSEPAPERIFVVQEHHASHLHWDFRLEEGGVLKSWAVPKGPPLEEGEKRLATHVEDHPFTYHTFEGTIPEGNYGAGTVKIWDRGTYTPAKGTSIKAGLKEGKFSFILKSQKLKRLFSLVRFTNEKENEWFFIKNKEKN